MKYEYLIGFMYREGVGRLFADINREIKSSEDIEALDKFVEQKLKLQNQKVTVISYQLIRKYVEVDK